jgi:hypothetical protein
MLAMKYARIILSQVILAFTIIAPAVAQQKNRYTGLFF